MNDKEKLELALTARTRSYSSYSNFKVGALVIFKDGSYVMGANIENSSYGLTNCAERSAIFASISAGKDLKDAVELVCVADTPKPVSPCGACRQVMREFFGPDFIVTLFNLKGDKMSVKLADLLPYAFTKDDLK